MHATRAASFIASDRAAWRIVPDWPRLPASITLDRVVGVAVDSAGLVYVAHRGDHPLLCLNPDGTLHHEIGAAHLKKTTAYDLRGPVPVPIATRYWLHGLHIDPWDNLWVTDVGRHLVMKFDPHGALALTLGIDGEPGADAHHFSQPTHVCVVRSGEFFVSDGYGNSRIVKFNADGERLFEWGRRGTEPGEFHTPHALTLGRDGLLYVADRENDRVQLFDQSGTFVALWPDLHSVDGLHAAHDGSLYGTSGIDNALLRFDPFGRVANVCSAPGMFRYPHAVASDATGALYTAETGDVWVVTGRDPAERICRERTGPDGSALKKLVVAATP